MEGVGVTWSVGLVLRMEWALLLVFLAQGQISGNVHLLLFFYYSLLYFRSSNCAISKAAATVGYAANAERNATDTKCVFFLHFLAYKQVH